MKLLSLTLFSALLVSCASPLTQPQPAPKNGLVQVKSAMDSRLFDGESARYKNVSGPKLRKTGRGMQYLMTYDVNAKNRYGGYTGFTPYLAMFVDGQVDAVVENQFRMFLK